MNSLALFVVELQIARRRLITIFEEPDGASKAATSRHDKCSRGALSQIIVCLRPALSGSALDRVEAANLRRREI